MPALNLRVRHGEGEPAYALFRRLATRNAVTSIRDFGELTGLHYGNILRGRDLERLADLNNSSVDDLRRWTPIKVKDCWTLNGHRLSRGSWRPERATYCAECLIAGIGEVPDGITTRHAALLRGAYRRVWWDLAFIDCCTLHRSLLVRVCKCGRRITAGDALARRCPGGCDRASFSGEKVPAALIAPDAYLLGRLGVTEAPPPVGFLDELPIDLAAALMQHVGAALADGHQSTGPLMGAYRCEVRLAGLRFCEGATSDGVAARDFSIRGSRRLADWLRGKASTQPLQDFAQALEPPKGTASYELAQAAALAGIDIPAFLKICNDEKIPPIQPNRWSSQQVQIIRHFAQPELLMPMQGGGFVPDRDLEPLPKPRRTSRRRYRPEGAEYGA